MRHVRDHASAGRLIASKRPRVGLGCDVNGGQNRNASHAGPDLVEAQNIQSGASRGKGDV